ncbi:MAG TPA: hypothetical protein VNI01_08900 [Elusimicrobiota bacterium]|jgi:hypothetical protein|nr:hypothetical protein [Elusimicrobiota bacterium]
MKTMIAGFLLLALCGAPESRAAAAAMEHGSRAVKMLNDSATALQKIDPDLAGRLQQYATKEAAETGKTEMKNAGDEKGDIQLLRDSASALKKTRPDLAKALNRYADKESREMRRSERRRTP